MLTPPSPSRSPSLTPNDTNSRKRQRTASMDSQPSSSSKRSISGDPSQESLSVQQSYDRASPSVTHISLDAELDIDTYMADQGEATIPSSLDQALQRWQDNGPEPELSGEQKLAFIDDLLKAKLVPGDTWYLVSRPWYRRWRKACSGEVDKEGPVSETDLGPVDNSPLVDSFGNIDTPPVDGINVEFFPQKAWDSLVSWYGQPQWTLPRKVITRGFMNEPSVESMPPRLKVYILVSDDVPATSQEPVIVTMSLKDTVQKLVSSFTRAVRTSDTERPTRIWRLDDSDYPTLEFPVSKLKEGGNLLDVDGRQALDEAMIDSGDAFAVEFQTEQGWLVSDTESQTLVSGASTPQSSASAAPATTKLFGTGASFFDQLQAKSSPSGSELVKSGSTILKPPASIKSSFTTRASKSPQIDPGTLGLINMGNTCFMNSAIQCLVHTRELTDYFLTGVYEDELNPDNPLGMHGDIAESFGGLLRRIWDPSQGSSYAPREFKQALQRFAPQFSGYQQHDSQEFVAFLLDGLHEDLNRVLKKPYVEKPDWEGGGDKELAALARESWEGYMKRNDSVIVDLFQGQYQSTLVCPVCEKVSITFDPFMYLTLPLPIQKKVIHEVFFVPWDLTKPHVKIPVELNRDSSLKELRQLLGRWMDVNSDYLITLEIFSHKFYKDLNDHCAWGDIMDKDIIVCYELPCPASQGRPHKRQDGDPFIVPVFLCDTIRPTTGRQYGSNSTGTFGYPFLMAIDEKDACDKDALYNLVMSRLERWADNAENLSKWEPGSPTDSAEDSLEEVPIPITSDAPADSMVEINENGDVITVEEPVPEEGDIVDQKHVVIRDSEEPPVEVRMGPPRKLGYKKDVIQLHIQPHTQPYGVGFPSMGPTRSGLASWDLREEEAKDNSPPVLLHANDALVCEVDAHMKSFYFGDHAKWDKWDTFVHPEFKASREAAKAASKKSISLQDCLDEFTKEEKLGEDDLWYCPRCKKHQQATKRFDLWKVPDILVVHLKRFSNSRTLRDKIDAFVDFPIEGLDLTPMIGERQVAQRLVSEGVDLENLGFSDVDEPLVYDLYGVDEHLGGLGGGHYRAYSYNHVTDKWYHFDDQYVSVASAESAVNANAYLLFYKRRTSRPLGGKTHDKIVEARLNPKPQSSSFRAYEEPTQLPTPPSERLRPLITLPGSFDHDGGLELTPPVTRSSSASRGSSPPPLDDGDDGNDADPPSFEDSAYDPLILSTHRFDMPDPSASPSMPSPSSSLEAEMDSDDLDSAGAPSQRPRWPSVPPADKAESDESIMEIISTDDDEMV